MKKLTRYLVIAVLVLWLVKDPTGAAALARHAMSGLSAAVRSLSAFASGLS